MKKVLKHMKIVLIQDVPNLGKIGEEKEVKPGYARNFLLKQNLAVLPNDEKARMILEERRQKQEKAAQEKEKISQEIGKISDQKIIFKVKVNKYGKPFKAIQPKEIAQKLNLSPALIISKPIQKVGEHQILIKKGDLERQIKVEVIAEK